mmetsp:Transcript_15818/g.55006  ORF Transcript_15818/g.55006 Transcript_15818/m.55006 type:complete len:260 (+) Transcript_15818:821-1600(+)
MDCRTQREAGALALRVADAVDENQMIIISVHQELGVVQREPAQRRCHARDPRLAPAGAFHRALHRVFKRCSGCYCLAQLYAGAEQIVRASAVDAKRTIVTAVKEILDLLQRARAQRSRHQIEPRLAPAGVFHRALPRVACSCSSCARSCGACLLAAPGRLCLDQRLPQRVHGRGHHDDARGLSLLRLVLLPAVFSFSTIGTARVPGALPNVSSRRASFSPGPGQHHGESWRRLAGRSSFKHRHTPVPLPARPTAASQAA